MRIAPLAAAAVVLSACALSPVRVEVQSLEPFFKAHVAAIGAVHGVEGNMDERVIRKLIPRLRALGIKAVSLQDSDSVLAGSSLGLDVAGDPRVLAEVRRATSADTVVILTLAPGGRSLDVVALDAAGGDAMLRAAARPKTGTLVSVDDIAAAAAQALSAVAPGRRAAAAREKAQELPPP